MEHFAKIVNGFRSLTISAKRFIISIHKNQFVLSPFLQHLSWIGVLKMFHLYHKCLAVNLFQTPTFLSKPSVSPPPRTISQNSKNSPILITFFYIWHTDLRNKFSVLPVIKINQSVNRNQIYNLFIIATARGHSFSTYATFSEKLTFLTP